MSVTAPRGFAAAGVHCGIKASGQPDLALVATADHVAVPAAGVFTQNLACAGPVQVSKRHLRASSGHAAAVILNSGNANCATGTDPEVAEEMCILTALELRCRIEQVLVCSTGLIGIPLEIDPLRQGIPAVAAALDPAWGGDAARAIMTTDSVPKEVSVWGDGWTIGGMAKGAAMLAPNMATMLAVLTTDAALDPATLHAALKTAVSESFNALSVDGCTSTNDTVLVLASGRAGPPDRGRFQELLGSCCADLARQMAGDAEGATKVVTVRVQGASSVEEARRAARRVAESQLVKCSLYGRDPYWGRIVSELGSAHVAFDPDRVSVAYNGVTVCRDGVAAPGLDEAKLAAQMQEREIEVVADLGLGAGVATILTNDLSHAYIDENMGTS
jgi:glutamate N-acetyltransferase/amino-acid N-acetyltransferase